MQEKLILSVLPGEIPLSKLNLAGTHDSATAFVSLSKCVCPLSKQNNPRTASNGRSVFGYPIV